MRATPHSATQALLPVCLGIGLLVGMTACGTAARGKPIVLPTATSLSVIVTTDKLAYQVAQPMGVTVQNAGGSVYYVTDNHTACTIVQLQQLIAGAWQNVLSCSTGQPPHILEMPPHSSQPFTLAPGNATNNPNAWAPGVYRVALSLSTHPDGSGQPILVYSSGFQVAAPTQ